MYIKRRIGHTDNALKNEGNFNEKELSMDYIQLNNGLTMPSLGIGVFTFTPDEAEASVLHAIEDDYTLIDTANAYLNERGVGRAIKRSGVDRSHLFVSTKLWPSVYHRAAETIDETLARLQLDYVDLLFLHQPIGDIDGAYHAIEDAVKAGKVRSIGLSNFSEEEIQNIIAHHEIKPAVLQAESHPYYQDPKRAVFLAKEGINLMAWYPLGHGDHVLLEEPIFVSLAEKYHKTPAQVILRWHTQIGHSVIPGSRNPAHIKDNFDIFDFRLTEEEMAQIAKLDQNKLYYHRTQEALEDFLHFAPDFNAQK